MSAPQQNVPSRRPTRSSRFTTRSSRFRPRSGAGLIGLVLAGLMLAPAGPAFAAGVATPPPSASSTGGTSTSTGGAGTGGTSTGGAGTGGTSTGGAGTGGTATGTGTASTDVATVARSLATDPLYVSTAPGTPSVVAGDIRGALPPDVYVAVLPASAADQVGGEAAALPGAVLGQLPRPGTVLVLTGSELDGASRTQAFDRVQTVLGDARNRLAAKQPLAATLVLAARGLTGSGQLSDPPAPDRAGSPSGGGLLWVVLGLVVAAILAIPILLRRAKNAPPAPPPTVLRDRVEVDAYGRIVRRQTAKERAEEQERGTP